MATIKRKGYVFMEYEDDFTNRDWEKQWRPIWREFKATESANRVLIGEQTIALEIPDDFDPRGRQIAALEAEERDITAAFHRRVTEIRGQIANLQAITFDGATA